jgi:UDP-N-acetylmuramoylalanine--D-glutamate ligase
MVLGLGVSGRAAVSALLSNRQTVQGVDDQWEQLEDDAEIQALVSQGLQGGSSPSWEGVHRLITSPGVPPEHPVLQEAAQRGVAVIAEVEWGLERLPNRAVAVTGTNGKTTVTELCAHLLRHAGLSATAAGNNGVPICGLDLDAETVLVLELSSFQIDGFSKARFEAAVLLNLSPDHLDRYGTMEVYARSKARLGKLLLDEGVFWVQDRCIEQFPGVFNALPHKSFGCNEAETDAVLLSEGLSLEGVEYILPVEYMAMGKNDRLNVLAALLLCKELGVPLEDCLGGIQSFRKPEHRVEWVASADGVSFFNDSKGTNVEAVIHAIDCMPGPVHLIAGGVDKGGSYEPWLEAFEGRVQQVYLIGEASERIADSLAPHYVSIRCEHLEDALDRACTQAKTGESILLSPGCSSFDQFRNYAHRGTEFKRLVCERLGAEKR